MTAASAPEILREFRKKLVGLPVSHASAMLVAHALLDVIHENFFEARLKSGDVVGHGDAGTCWRLLEELKESAQTLASSPNPPAPSLQLQQIGVLPASYLKACPDCGHEHLDDKQCNFPIALNRICMCERKVVA